MDTTRRITPRSVLIAAVAIGVIAVVLSGAWRFYLLHTRPATTTVSFYENGAYQTYEITGREAAAIEQPPTMKPGAGFYPGGARLLMPPAGLEWRVGTAATGTSKLLIDRAGRTPESSFVSEDGTLAVLYNDVTNALDVFSVTYEGAYVSYLASIPAPAAPSYLIAGAAMGPSTVVIHQGSPESFIIYHVEAGKAEKTATASLIETK